MRGWLLDTNVVSELRRPRWDLAVRAWADRQARASLHLSVVTLAEVRYEISRVADPAFRVGFEEWLDSALRRWFAGRVLPVDEDTILRWRELVDRGRARKRTFSYQ